MCRSGTIPRVPSAREGTGWLGDHSGGATGRSASHGVQNLARLRAEVCPRQAKSKPYFWSALEKKNISSLTCYASESLIYSPGN